MTWFSDRIETVVEDARSLFSPYLNPSDMVSYGYLGSKGLPVIWAYKYFFCLTLSKVCFIVKKPFGRFEYIDIFYEEIVTSEIVRPSFLFFLVTFIIGFFFKDADDIIRSEIEFLNRAGVHLEPWQYGPLYLFIGFCSLVPSLLLYALIYLLVSRPTLTLAAYGSGNLIAVSARGQGAQALQTIIQGINRLRQDRDKVDVRNVAYGP
jgi:hypothetical protein